MSYLEEAFSLVHADVEAATLFGNDPTVPLKDQLNFDIKTLDEEQKDALISGFDVKFCIVFKIILSIKTLF